MPLADLHVCSENGVYVVGLEKKERVAVNYVV